MISPSISQEAVFPDVMPTSFIEETAGEKGVLSDKKSLGAYYTPGKAARVLANWAIKKPTDIILEPSFGGCEFLISTKERLEQLGNNNPDRKLYGCDIDPNAFVFLQSLLPKADTSKHFKQLDFLLTRQHTFPKADVVIGNPPYVSRHNMKEVQREAAWATAELAGITISKKASLWVYFVLHSLNFLKEGGRIAWILPGSFIYADYSVALRSTLINNFSRCLAIELKERLFTQEGTEESSVIILCEGYKRSGGSEIEIVSASTVLVAEELIAKWAKSVVVGMKLQQRPLLSLMSLESSICYQRLLQSPKASKLGDLLDLTIGIVTGDAKFFVLTKKDAEARRLPAVALQSILSKFAHCQGMELTTEDMHELRDTNKRCLLLDTRLVTGTDEHLDSYLASYPEIKRLNNKTFIKRTEWHQPDDGVRPDAFFSCMQANGPVLVLNNTGTLCTNSIYRAVFSASTPLAKQQVIAVSLQSTFSQFAAEVEGRTYGSGALKLEPSEGKRIALLLPQDFADVSVVFSKIDGHLRSGNREVARQEADAYLISKKLISQEAVTILAASLKEFRKGRKGIKLAG